MSISVEDVQTFFGRLEDDEEGRKVYSYLDHDFQFKVTGAGDFLLRREGQGFAVEERELPNPDFRRVSVMETDAETLRGVMVGRIRPADAVYTTRLRLDGLAANKAYDHGLLRLFRRGAELNR